MAIPHGTDPYERLAGSVPLPARKAAPTGNGCAAVAQIGTESETRQRAPTPPWKGGRHDRDRRTRGRRSGGRAARQAARAARACRARAVPDAHAASRSRCCPRRASSLLEENADRILEEVGIEFHDAPDALELFAGAGATVDGERVRFPRGLCRSLVQATAPADVHAGRAEPRQRRRLRRPRDDLRAGLRLAVRARPRRRPPLRDDRGLPELREARVRVAVDPPLRRHGLRAGRRARQQAALRHGLRAHPLLGQGVHGLGHATRAGARTRSRWRGSSSARDFLEENTVVFSLDQRQLAARLGRVDARRGAGVRRGEPGGDDDAVHPRGRDEPRDGRGVLRADARRVAGRDGVRAARATLARRSCSARSHRRCRCSRARRRSARPSPRSSST